MIGGVASLLITAGLGAVSPPVTEPVSVERRFLVMGTELTVEVTDESRERAVSAAEATVRAVERVEARLSTWTEESELARLNRSPVGRVVELSPELADDLRGAVACRDRTDGAFDPSVGPLVRAWDLRGEGKRPSDGEIARAREAVDIGALRLGTDGTAVRSDPELVLEEGAFGKGAGLDAAYEALAALEVDAARLDLGGQFLVLGDVGRIDVADPQRRTDRALGLRLDRGSLATSGNSERGIVVEGERLGHLLDPRTGRPAPDFGSLSVWAPTAFEADCLSTGLYVLGPEEALRWAGAEEGIEVLVLEPTEGGLRARMTSGLAARVEAVRPDIEIEIFETPRPTKTSTASDNETERSRGLRQANR